MQIPSDIQSLVARYEFDSLIGSTSDVVVANRDVVIAAESLKPVRLISEPEVRASRRTDLSVNVSARWGAPRANISYEGHGKHVLGQTCMHK